MRPPVLIEAVFLGLAIALTLVTGLAISALLKEILARTASGEATRQQIKWPGKRVRVNRDPDSASLRRLLSTILSHAISWCLVVWIADTASFPPETAEKAQVLLLASCVVLSVYFGLERQGLPREGRLVLGAFAGLSVYASTGHNVSTLFTGFASALAALLVGVYNSNRVKKIERKLQFTEQQLELLYGPSLALLEELQVQYAEVVQWVGLDDKTAYACSPNQWKLFSQLTDEELDPKNAEPAKDERRIGMLNAFAAFQAVPGPGAVAFQKLYRKHVRSHNQRLVDLFAKSQHLLAPNVNDVPPSIAVFMAHAVQLAFRSKQFKRGSDTMEGLTHLSTVGLIHFPVTLLLEIEVKHVLLQALVNKYRTQLEFARVLDMVSSKSRLPERSLYATEAALLDALRTVCKDARTGQELRRALLLHVSERVKAELVKLGFDDPDEQLSGSLPGGNRHYLQASNVLTADWLKRLDRLLRKRVHSFHVRRDALTIFYGFGGA